MHCCHTVSNSDVTLAVFWRNFEDTELEVEGSNISGQHDHQANNAHRADCRSCTLSRA